VAINVALEETAAFLRARRVELTADLDRLTEPPAEGSSIGFGKRVGEGTSEAVERLATTATARSIAASIKDIDRALVKVETGTYGFCDSCGDPIPEARLEALPATALCVSCASKA
jgi:DnaK suppressor protein